MIGSLLLGPGRTAVLDDDLTWRLDPPDGFLSTYLNGRFGAANHEPGDHHAPRGAALLDRAAKALGVPIRVSPRPLPDLPPDAVS